MSLFVCKWKKEFGSEVKENIRRDICDSFSKLTGVDAKYFAVIFEDYAEGDFPEHNIGVFVLISQTEGRDDAFKDAEVKLVTDAFCKYTGWDSSRVSIMILDILRGSMGTKGIIVNRNGAAAEAIKSKEIDV